MATDKTMPTGEVIRGVHKQFFIDGIERFYQLANLGTVDKRVLNALRSVNREVYLPQNIGLEYIYDSGMALLLNKEQVFARVREQLATLDITPEQFAGLPEIEGRLLFEALSDQYVATSSQPRLIAYMLQSGLPVQKDISQSKAVEVGAGCGYLAALLSQIGYKEVYAIEIDEHLAEMARVNLRQDNRTEVKVVNAEAVDWLKQYGQEEGPFQTIIVSASVRDKGVITSLLENVEVGGRLIVPLVVESYQTDLEFAGLPGIKVKSRSDTTHLQRHTPTPEGIQVEDLHKNVAFVDLKV